MSFKKDLLEILDDKDIQEKIVRILKNADTPQPQRGGLFPINSNQDNRLKSENENLRTQIWDLTLKYQQVEGNYADLDYHYQKLQKELSTYKAALSDCKSKMVNDANTIQELRSRLDSANEETQRLRNEVKKYQKYVELEELYQGYLSLSGGIREGLDNSISDRNISEFLVSASQWESIQALWKYIKYQLDRISQSELNVLIDTFNWFFNRYNQFKNTYSMLSVEVGETFDSDYHAKSSNSKSSGIISEVLLLGYKNGITGDIIEKSIVRV